MRGSLAINTRIIQLIEQINVDGSSAAVVKGRTATNLRSATWKKP